ncbi:MAG TPA: L,D-transpeptidase/peptidoglycan binding protein [Actinomycetota bacterium]|nr:L,D-transpeptidase/peptidoglycan binding protein [Actinomycetota bacterium]
MRLVLQKIRRVLFSKACALTSGVLSISLVAAGGGAVAYDRNGSGLILPNTRIAGVSVGGLTREAAVAAVKAEVEDPLHKTVRVHGAGFDRTTTPWELGMRVDVATAVEKALDEAERGSVADRVWRRRFGGGQRDFSLAPELKDPKMRSLVSEAAEKVRVPAQDAKMSSAGGWIRVTPSQPGRALDVKAAESDLERAVHEGGEVALRTKVVEPKVSASAFSKVILVRAGENKLYLYESGEISRTYSVATGAPEFETPRGTFTIVRKRKNPTWVNPGSDWSKKLPGQIPPGPDNPLGSRALDLNVGGIRIHGTPDSGSIGYSVSHGCIRMHMPEAEDLFARVETGTRVVIVSAGPSKPRAAKGAKPSASPAAPAAPAPAPPAAPAA